jgi:hypothetical protein
MKKLYDLRFVIGMFFLVIGVLLIGYVLFASTSVGVSINKWCGILFILFGGFMLALSLKKPVE